MRRIFALMLVMVFMSSFLTIAPIGVSASTEVPEATIINVSADTYVDGNNTAKNYGEGKYIVLKPQGGNRFPFFKFDISSIRSNLSEFVEIESATISLCATGAGDNISATATTNSVVTQLYYVTDDTWSETGLTYENKPQRGEAISDEVTIGAGVSFSNANGGVSYNVTDAIKNEVAKTGDSYLSCTLDGAVSTNENIGFISKELGNDKNYAPYIPKLTVTYKVKSLVPEATVIKTTEDTWANGSSDDNKTKNYGTGKFTVLRVTDKIPFFKFDISQIRKSLSEIVEIESAVVTLYAAGNTDSLSAGATTSNVATELYYVNDDSWNESTLTYNNMPALGVAISSEREIPSGTQYNSGNGSFSFNYDITQAVKDELSKDSDNYLSCALNGDTWVNQNIGIFSKENTENNSAYAPKLTVTYKLKSFDPDNAVITPLADAYVGSGESEKTLNYGGSPYLLYKPSVRLSYLKFDVSDVRSTLSSLSETTSIRTAKIRLYAVGADRIKEGPTYTATTASVDVRAYSVANDSWVEGTGNRNGEGDTESGISYNTKPDKGDGISEAVTIPAGTVYSAENAPYFELDITDALLAENDNTFSCVIDGDTYVNQTVYFFSSEYTDVVGLVPTLTVDYALKEDIATDITSTALTVDGEYIHGYSKDETVQSLISKIVIPEGATASVYDGNTTVSNSATVKQGMKLHIVSKDTTKTKDYTICNGELFVGSPVYSVSGVKSDGTYADTRIAVSIPVINYTDEAKKLNIIVARYNGETLEKAVVSEQTATARFNDNLTYTYTDGERAATVSYKVFVWEKDTLVPRAGSQLYSSAAAGKKVVVFGDSISAPNSGYVKLLADATSANITNAAVAGARIIAGNDGRPHDTYGINLQTIVSKLYNGDTDWSQQESYTNGGKESDDDKANIANYKNIDLANTDAVIIWMGTNDYGTDISLTDFETAVKDVLDKLTAKNANLKIVLASPMYRAILDSGDAKNCYEYTNGIGKYLYEYCDVLENLSKDYANVTFLDMYNESGITKFSQEKYEYLGDGLHPKSGESDANKIIYALFAQKLATVLK